MVLPPEDLQFEALLNYVKNNRGFDFTGYKRSSLMRRVSRRMQTLNIEGYDSYLDYLEVHPGEFNYLFNTLLINVTAFFRDRTIWDYLSSEIVPLILSRKRSTDRIRVWSAGCATGEEAYTAAMVLAEVLGVDQFQERVKIYATDVDEDALTQARQATYPEQALTELTPERRDRFFVESEDYYTFHRDLRRSVIFGRHDLIQDAPISKIDLLLCRNTLMYFNADIQARILSRFHFALNEDSFLLLGKAEMLTSYSNLFVPIHLKRRIFAKVPRPNGRNVLLPPALSAKGEESTGCPPDQLLLQAAAFEGCPLAYVVFDLGGALAFVNDRARALFNLTLQDLGRRLQDLEISYRPLELRSRIDQVYQERRSLTISSIEWLTRQGELLYLDIQITPLLEPDDSVLGVSVSFTDVSRFKRLQEELEHSNQELEMAYEELQSTNEELETTNEELQSSSEELETTNEELQSTNEELETMNEELQSANEELQTLNEELQRSSDDLNQSNAFLESILTSLRAGVVVVDRNLNIQVWNYKSTDLWGLREDEVINQGFLNLDTGLPADELLQSIRDCLANPNQISEQTLTAINRRGRTIQCTVTCTPLLERKQVTGVILLMEDHEDSQSEESKSHSRYSSD